MEKVEDGEGGFARSDGRLFSCQSVETFVCDVMDVEGGGGGGW